MLRHEVGFRAASKSKRVDEEECEYDHDGAEDAPPETLVHECFRLLFPVDQIFHGDIE